MTDRDSLFARAGKDGGRVTKKQRKAVRKALRDYDGSGAWAGVLAKVRDYYAQADPACWELLRLRYIEGRSEWDVVGLLHIGRTTYYHKELEALSTVAVYAAAEGLMPSQSAAPTAPPKG